MLSVARITTARIILLGDVHGRFDLFRRVLHEAGLRGGVPADATFVQVGDLVDRGRESERSAMRQPALPLPAPGALVRAAAPGGSPWRLGDVLDRTLPCPAHETAAERACILAALDVLVTVREFIAFEARSEGRVIVLMGNHDLDLLRGRFLYARRQKEYLCVLLGLSDEQAARHADEGLPLAQIASASAEMAWLVRRPLMAAGHGLVAVHGGPTRDLVKTFAGLQASQRDRMERWLTQAREDGRHDAFAEGNSLLSPDGPDSGFVADDSFRQRFLALMGADILAVGHSAFLHAAHVERPALLAGRQILKLDTDVKRGGPMWLTERRDGAWTATSSDGRRCPVAVADGAQDCPSSDDIETRLFAVHGTHRFPDRGIVAAGSDLPAHFRPGVHFSLGGLSPGMDAGYCVGVVAPLGSLAKQLLSVGPTDSFVLGDVALTARMTILLPEGEPIDGVPPDVPVVFYPLAKGLRRAIDDVILDARGWDVVLPASFEIGHVARIERRDIATSRFFERFLARYPHVSFGGHAASEVGEAALFGMTDRLIQGLSRAYRSRSARPLSGARLTFVTAVIDMFLARIDASCRPIWPASCLVALEDVVRAARSWIGIARRDLALRQTHGRPLAGTAEIGDAFAGEVFGVLDHGTLRDLAARAIAIPIDRAAFGLEYATTRWLTLRTERACREGLDRVFADAAERYVIDAGADTAPPWLARLHHHLSFESNRRIDARTILELPCCRDLIGRCRLADLPLPPVRDMSIVFKNEGRW